MKKAVAMFIAVVMMLAFGATAFAQTYAYVEWNEELQQYEISVIDDGDSDPCFNPEYQDYLNQNGGSGFVIVNDDGTCEIDLRDY